MQPAFPNLSAALARWLLILAGVGGIVMMSVIGRVEGPLKNGVALDGGLSLQRAGTAERANKVIGSWKGSTRGDGTKVPDVLPNAVQGVEWDFLFIACYATFFCLLCRHSALAWQAVAGSGAKPTQPPAKSWAAFATLLSWLALVAGAADVMEDVGLLLMLHKGEAGIWPLPVYLCSTVKFALIIACALGFFVTTAARSPLGFWHGLGRGLMWLFLLRVPGLVLLTMVLLPCCYLFKIGPYEMVAGAYDAPGFMQIALVGLAVGSLAGCILMTARLILDLGLRRYNVPGRPKGVPFWGNPLPVRIFVLAGIVPTLLACLQILGNEWTVYHSVAYLLAGAACAALPVWIVYLLQGSSLNDLWGKWARKHQGIFGALNRFFVCLGRGFVHKDATTRQTVTHRVHYQNLCFALVSLLVFGLLRFFSPTDMPAVLYVLLLLLVICWTLSALSFLLDRFHIPLIIALVVWLWLVGFVGRDYHFRAVKAEALTPLPAGTTLTTAEHLLRKSATLTSGTTKRRVPPIFVTAQGGGIHSGCWAVEVLTGLEELCQEAGPDHLHLSQGVRLVSGVSGGSYGLLYYADAYQNGQLQWQEFDAKQQKTFPGELTVREQDIEGHAPPTLHPPVNSMQLMRARVMRDSLSTVVRALVYRDVWTDFLPLGIGKDRATRMEERWAQGTDLATHRGKVTTMNDWTRDAFELMRPAVLFNSTCVETGRPVVFGTSWTRQWMFDDRGDSPPTATVPVVTGARLSASFPFVSAAASPKARKDDKLDLQQEHFVDGGYYDNYGLVSLTHWLEDGLLKLYGEDFTADIDPKTAPVTRLLIIQIRYKQNEKQQKDEAHERGKGMTGGLFQDSAPLVTLANVRSAAQNLRNDEEFDVFCKYWAARGVTIDNAMFEFDADAPLSWHLTPADKDALEQKRIAMKARYATVRKLKDLDARIAAKTKPGVPDDKELAELKAERNKIETDEASHPNRHALGDAADLVMRYLEQE